MKNENIQLVLLCPVYEVQLNESFIVSKSYINEKWEVKEKKKKKKEANMFRVKRTVVTAAK